MSTILEKIRARGHWRVVIRPGRFEEKRIQDIAALYPLIQKTSVELRGWDFPHVNPHSNPRLDVDWVEQESEWQEYLEVWRFFQSGQFVDIAGMPEDWHSQSSSRPPDNEWRPGTLLGIGNALYTFTEIFEFAARLALTDAGDDQIHIEIKVIGLAGRGLWFDFRDRWPLSRRYEASLNELPYEIELNRDELAAQPRDLALEPATQLFARFGWNPSIEMLKDFQKNLWK